MTIRHTANENENPPNPGQPEKWHVNTKSTGDVVFRVSMGDEGAGTETEFNVSMTKEGGLVFRPGIDLKEILNNQRREKD